MVITDGSRLAPGGWPPSGACLAERGGGTRRGAGARGCRREAARRAPKVPRRSGRTETAVSRGRVAPARQAAPGSHQVALPAALSRGEVAPSARGALRAPLKTRCESSPRARLRQLRQDRLPSRSQNRTPEERQQGYRPCIGTLTWEDWVELRGFEPLTPSMRTSRMVVDHGRWRRSEGYGGRMRSMSCGAAAAVCCRRTQLADGWRLRTSSVDREVVGREYVGQGHTFAITSLAWQQTNDCWWLLFVAFSALAEQRRTRWHQVGKLVSALPQATRC
jgi:hypothetical protein